MTEKERVTVDFDSESYYLDGEFWVSWDHYGEDMADNINNLLNKQDERIKQHEELISEQAIQLDYLKDENRHMSEVLDENKQLKQQLHNFVQLANENDKTLNELYQYMESYFDSQHENTYWNPKILRG